MFQLLKISNTTCVDLIIRAIGAALVTIPSVGYLIQPQLNKHSSHGHDEGGHGEHAEHGEKDHDEDAGEGGEKSGEDEDAEAEKSEGAEDAPDGYSKGDDDGEDGSVQQSTGSGSDDPPRPDHSVLDAGQGDPEHFHEKDPKGGGYEVDSGSNVEGVRFKGASSGGTREGEQGDTRKHIPDPKGFSKKRIQSHYAKDQGILEEEDSPDTDKVLFFLMMDAELLIDGALGCTFQTTDRSQHNISEAGRPYKHQYQAFYRSGQ